VLPFHGELKFLIKSFLGQHGDLVFYALGNLQSVEADECIASMIRASEMEDQPCRRVQDRL